MGTLLREVIGDVLRRARTTQGRTLREVSDAARVSLGYLSEVERGRKEASSELLSAICGALDVPLSRVLSDAGDEMAQRGAQRVRPRVGERDQHRRHDQGRHPAGRVHGGRLARRRGAESREPIGLAVPISWQSSLEQFRHEGGMNPWPIRSSRRGAT